MMNLIVPLSVTFPAGVTQLVALKSVFGCRFHPVEGDGQEAITVVGPVCVMVKNGAPGVGTAAMTPQ